MNEDRKQEAVDAFEALAERYADVFSMGVELPVISDWCFVIATDSASDPEAGNVYRLNRRFQASYRSAGLLQMAVDDYRGVTVGDD